MGSGTERFHDGAILRPRSLWLEDSELILKSANETRESHFIPIVGAAVRFLSMCYLLLAVSFVPALLSPRQLPRKVMPLHMKIVMASSIDWAGAFGLVSAPNSLGN